MQRISHGVLLQSDSSYTYIVACVPRSCSLNPCVSAYHAYRELDERPAQSTKCGPGTLIKRVRTMDDDFWETW